MAAVEIVDSSMVTPGEATPGHAIWLSNLDLLVARSHTPTVYVYRPTASDDPASFFSPDVLKAALSKALVLFYPLAGRLAQDSAGRPEISCTGEGVLFVTARSGAAVDDLGDFAPSDELRRMLVPMADDASGGGLAGVLAMIQVTFFRCGGVSLGVAVHHTAADGLASLDFVNTWAAIARGAAAAGEAMARPRLCLDRTLLRARSPPAVLFDHAEYSRRGGGSKLPFLSAILPLSKNQLNALKGVGAGGVQGKKLSTFTAVVAHIWRCACKARGLARTEETRLYMTADARTRVQPPLPRRYLGNAIFRASTVAKVDDIIATGGPLDTVAEKVSGATARLDDDYVRSLLDYLEQPASGGGAAGLRKGEWVMPATDLWVISWQGLPLYDADFGWGRPAFMGRACLQFSGLVYLVPGPDGDGRLDVVVAMEPESLAKFKKVFYDELSSSVGTLRA
ncbi:putrescine hydroxycinnamoyltransferase 1-like [Oryza brachyantha]|uniref:putrescine hydroxycinnamoyltransferase 1-like n=1 Tax=Oryza brachyantha TaxID=4533 RepID=UPI001ADBBF42|nr:putrescine hydroxycinnamoyltransferase 1-like [Oryza brachyantha]